jgi:hypothetical protein
MASTMMPIMLRRLVVALSVLAFVSGMTVQAVPSAGALGISTAAADAKEGSRVPSHGDRAPQPGHAGTCTV